jgi:hypothetical protein
MQNAPWHGPIPSRVVRRRSSSEESPRSERRGQPGPGDHLALAQQLGVTATGRLVRREPIAEPVRAPVRRARQLLVGGPARRVDAKRRRHPVNGLRGHEPIGRQLAADDAP